MNLGRHSSIDLDLRNLWIIRAAAIVHDADETAGECSRRAEVPPNRVDTGRSRMRSVRPNVGAPIERTRFASGIAVDLNPIIGQTFRTTPIASIAQKNPIELD